MHFLISSMSVVYVLTTPIPEDGENSTTDQIRRRNKWDNDDYVCRGLILNGMSDPLFDIYQNVESSKELLVSLEAKYMVKDASSKKFLVSNFTNYKMTDFRPVMEQYNELLGIIGRFTQHKMNMDAAIQVYYVTYVSKAYFMEDDDVAWLNIVNDNIALAFMSTSKLNDSIFWHARLGYVHFKRMHDMYKDRLIPAFDMDTKNDPCDLHVTPSLGNKKYFVTFIDDASRFCYVYLLRTKHEALDKFKVFKIEVELQQGSLIKRFRTNRGGLSQWFWGEAMLTACYLFNKVPNKKNKIMLYELWTKRKPNMNYLKVWGCKTIIRLPDPKLKTLGERVPRPSLKIPIRTEDIGGSVVPEEIRTKDEESDQHSYCFNVEDDPMTFDEAMKSQDVAF
ncbi:zinc finger, CCHC-type containing protein [Tanacetum coccineum]